LAVGELFLCGYNIRPDDREEASVMLEEAMSMIQPIAIENQIALLVPYAEKVEDSDQMFDSMLLVDKEGNLLRNYRKCQLWGSDERTVWKYPYTDTPDEVRLGSSLLMLVRIRLKLMKRKILSKIAGV
jgi:predicted amidohydrolase